jgi:hypothetical protein
MAAAQNLFDAARAARFTQPMRSALTLALLCLLARPAFGQEGMDLLQGKFGSADDPAASCAANPHTLAIIDSRPHLARIWEKPYQGSAGSERLREVYDLEAAEGMALTLSEEAPYHADPEGTGGNWVMQFTQSPQGYCWRRPDWPITRCIDQQLRCDPATS